MFGRCQINRRLLTDVRVTNTTCLYHTCAVKEQIPSTRARKQAIESVDWHDAKNYAVFHIKQSISVAYHHLQAVSLLARRY